MPGNNCNKNNDDYSKKSYDDQQCGLIIRASAFGFCEEKQGISLSIDWLLDVIVYISKLSAVVCLLNIEIKMMKKLQRLRLNCKIYSWKQLPLDANWKYTVIVERCVKEERKGRAK